MLYLAYWKEFDSFCRKRFDGPMDLQKAADYFAEDNTELAYPDHILALGTDGHRVNVTVFSFPNDYKISNEVLFVKGFSARMRRYYDSFGCNGGNTQDVKRFLKFAEAEIPRLRAFFPKG